MHPFPLRPRVKLVSTSIQNRQLYHLTVAGSGPGVEPADRVKVFTAFLSQLEDD